MEIAIANFFHCKNIPDAVVESPRFIWLVCLCCLVREDFFVPNQKQIEGDLLDLNYANVFGRNKANFSRLPRYLDWPFWAMAQPSIEWL